MPACSNDFEPVVFERFPELSSIKRRLVRLGARPALMSGSGSAFFGIFDEAEAVNHAANSLSKEQVFRISLVSRARYRSLWWRWLKPHIDEKIWPPRSRYAQ
jgi:4-diphosphocytidyl-2-C-methyl-D-erythritol kinase